MSNKTSRRAFLGSATLLGAGALLGSPMGWAASSYRRIAGANDRITVGLVGLGRRMGAFVTPLSRSNQGIELRYLCDVMASQRENAAARFNPLLPQPPALEGNYAKMLDDKTLDSVVLATPDHWHAPGTWMALQAGKHVYVEKPCCHNPREGELLVDYQQRFGLVVQMGNQQRSAKETIEVVDAIRKGVIGKTYLAKAFYTNKRGEVPVATAAPVPDGLDWDLWQGPAPRQSYQHNTWDYNWHWYGWDYGTAETGNNAVHELDVARWALDLAYPSAVQVWATKAHYPNDGWTMYDTMEANFEFANGKRIQWDGKSRNNQHTYGASDRGVIIYGTEGSAYIDRSGYRIYDRQGELWQGQQQQPKEPGFESMDTLHVLNFFEAIRGKAVQASPIAEGVVSTHYCHLANMAYRTGQRLVCDPATGRLNGNQAASAYWGRTYEKGYEPI